MHIAARDCKDWGFGLGFALNEVAGRCAYDATVYDGVSFRARSGMSAVSAKFTVGTIQTQPLEYGGDGTCESAPNAGCWDSFSVAVEVTPEWKVYSYRWADLAQQGFGKPVPFEVKQITSLTLSSGAKPTTSRELWLDDVRFFKGTPPAPSP
jgi:hypothetical protein